MRGLLSKRGLSQHERKAHPEQYVPTVNRRGWSEDECVLVAREEIRLVRVARAKGVTGSVNVNADLCRVFPHRSMDSVK